MQCERIRKLISRWHAENAHPLSHLEVSRAVLGLAADALGAPFSARRQETGKLRHIQEIEMADGREAMPKEGLSMVLFSLFA
jgi:hypothetical protein